MAAQALTTAGSSSTCCKTTLSLSITGAGVSAGTNSALQEQDSEEPGQWRATALGMELYSGDIEFSAFSPR